LQRDIQATSLEPGIAPVVDEAANAINHDAHCLILAAFVV
jgi:hypothetical protein